MEERIYLDRNSKVSVLDASLGLPRHHLTELGARAGLRTIPQYVLRLLFSWECRFDAHLSVN